MHKNFARDGLAVITVSLDSLTETDDKDKTKARVLDFLKRHNANFTNLLLDEETTFWQEKLRFIGPPCYYVFNRKGKWTQFADGVENIDYNKVDRLVEALLKEK